MHLVNHTHTTIAAARCARLLFIVALLSTGCDDPRSTTLVHPVKSVCCDSCDSPLGTYRGGLPCGEEEVTAALCPFRSPCHDAQDYQGRSSAYCCVKGCDSPEVAHRGGSAYCDDYFGEASIVAGKCPQSSACFRQMTRFATCDLAQTRDSWSGALEAGCFEAGTRDSAPGTADLAVTTADIAVTDGPQPD